MPKSGRAWHETPPTAGLPLSWRDFLPGTASFESELARFTGNTSTQITSSGTAAIMLALAALKKTSSRRNVIIPAYTCPYVPLAITRCGLNPVLCDTRPGHFDFDFTQLKTLCDHDTLAVMPTHLGGRVADLQAATDIARQAGAYVVEDAAQALGALWQGQHVGSIGDVGCYSLGVGKGLTIYGGGAATARDAQLQTLLRTTHDEIAPGKLVWEARRLLELAGYYSLYRPSGLKLAFGIPLRKHLNRNRFIEAAGDDCSPDFPVHRVGKWRKSIGTKALQRLPDFIARTSAQALRRKSLLEASSGISCIQVLGDNPGDNGVWPYILVLMPSEQARDKALATLWPAGLGVGRLFIHALPDYRYLSFPQTNTPNARDFAARTLTISNSPWLGDLDFKHICTVLEHSLA